MQSLPPLCSRIKGISPNISILGGSVVAVSDDSQTANYDDTVLACEGCDEFCSLGPHFATVSLILQAISQYSATEDGFLIQGSLLSVMVEGRPFGRLRRSLSIRSRKAHSSLSRSTGILYWGNATERS